MAKVTLKQIAERAGVSINTVCSTASIVPVFPDKRCAYIKVFPVNPISFSIHG